MDRTHRARHAALRRTLQEEVRVFLHPDLEETTERFLEGIDDYGEGNHHAPGYRAPWEARCELLDAFEQCCFLRERHTLGVEVLTGEQLDLLAEAVEHVLEAVRCFREIEASRRR